MTYKETLEKIATVNAMDYEYQAWAREALANQEQGEPVAWLCKKENGHFDVLTDKTCKKCFPVYTTPQPKQEQGSTCNETLRAQGKAYPRTCKKCGFGPCIGKPKQEQDEPDYKTLAIQLQQQRTWVGLAAEDRLCAKYMQDAPDGIEAVIDYIETKLKELNT